MDAREVQKIIRETARESVHETLQGLGLAVDEPHETQADLLYLRKIRKGSEFLSLRAKASLVVFLIPVVLYRLWDAFKDSMQR